MVLEMGMRGFGEIEALVSNRHAAHRGRHSCRRGAQRSRRRDRRRGRAKSELIAALPADGIAILNADDHRVRSMSRLTSASVPAVRRGRRCRRARTRRRARRPGPAVVRRRHAVGECRCAPVDQRPAHGDERCGRAGVRRRGRWRCRRRRRGAVERGPDGDAHAGRACGRPGAIILNDSYNANPTSMRAAIDALVDLPATRRVAMLGVMAEISDAAAEHRAIAELRSGSRHRADRGRHRPLRRRAVGGRGRRARLTLRRRRRTRQREPRGRARECSLPS